MKDNLDHALTSGFLDSLDQEAENMVRSARTTDHKEAVRAFIDQFTRIDETFSSRLRTGFIQEYEKLKKDDLSGDELFQEMLGFATGGRSDLTTQAAGLAVLGYYFEACEVFER